jgi:hypothetical protein
MPLRIYFFSRTFASIGKSDTYFIKTLLPWILQLHMNQEHGIQTFRNQNKIDRPMLCEDPFDLDYAELMKAIDDIMRISSKFIL